MLIYKPGDISGASMIDEEFTNINMMIKYYKFGFGRATDTINERIRAGLYLVARRSEWWKNSMACALIKL